MNEKKFDLPLDFFLLLYETIAQNYNLYYMKLLFNSYYWYLQIILLLKQKYIIII